MSNGKHVSATLRMAWAELLLLWDPLFSILYVNLEKIFLIFVLQHFFLQCSDKLQLQPLLHQLQMLFPVLQTLLNSVTLALVPVISYFFFDSATADMVYFFLLYKGCPLDGIRAKTLSHAVHSFI